MKILGIIAAVVAFSFFAAIVIGKFMSIGTRYDEWLERDDSREG